MPWKKDGIEFVNPLHFGGKVTYNPTAEMLTEAGYEWEDPVPPTVTIKDYDDAMEAHLRAEREARGYTTREPDYYLTSSVPRWAQDARDWVAHRDEVMLYALNIENKYESGEPVPTLDEFRTALPVITWTLELSDAEA